jgi:iron complex outermembrane recepter protein
MPISSVPQVLGLILFFSLSFSIASAQEVKIKGTLLDADRREPLEFANISLLSTADSALLRGALSELDGAYALMADPGDYLLRFSFVGYQTLYLPILAKEGRTLRLDPVLLPADAQVLEQVTVTSIRSMFQTDIDKRVYNVENSVIAQGGTAIDLLETLPSVQVDEEGNISMRGSGNILILINGRPSSLAAEEAESILAQFPANSIKSVEIISNPSARYDAAGIGGIINIILKEDQRQGMNGQVELSAGTRNKYTGGINLNYGLPKFNFFANYNYQYRELFELSESQRFSRFGQVSPQLDQDFNTDNIRQMHLLRTGMDFTPNDKLRFSLYFQRNANSRDRLRTYNQRHLNASGMRDSLIVRTLDEEQRAVNLEGSFTFDWDISEGGQQLSFSATYSQNTQERLELFDQLHYYGDAAVPGRREDQIYGRPRENSLAVFQLDYSLPLSEYGKLEAGLKSTLTDFDNRQFFEVFDASSAMWMDIDTITNRFQFHEGVHAAYLMYRNNFGKFGLQAGLRPELTLTESFEFNTGNTVVNNYFNLFPSLYLSYELGPEESLMLNYSRRVSRPRVGALAPFYNAQDFLNMRLGSPYLQPEFTDSYELGYSKGFNFLLFTGTLYHRRTTDLLTRVFVLQDNNAAVQTWVNANQRNASGLELINQFFLAKWADLTLTGNFFHSEIIADNVQEGFNNENFSWTISLLGSFRAGKWGNFQLQGNYRGPIVLPQGEIEPLYGINIGYRKDIWNRKANIAFNLTDVFNTRVFRIRTEDPRFSQTRVFNWESQIGTLAFTYRFGGVRAQDRPERNGDDIGDDPF